VQRVARRYLDVSQATLSVIRPQGTAVTDYTSHVTPYRVWDLTTRRETPVIATFHTKLDNGLTLILREDHSAPTVCVSAFIKGGQWLEPKGGAGLAWLTASLLDKGTEKYSREDFQAAKDELGVNLWNFAAEDYLQAGFSGLSAKLTASLTMLDEMLFHATFPFDELEKARTDQIQGIKSIPDQPWEYTHAEIHKDLYKNSPYRYPVLGVEAQVAKFTRKEVDDLTALENLRRRLLMEERGPDYITRLLDEYRDRALWQRAESIARTETIRAANMGQQLLWRQAAGQGLLDQATTARKWIVTRDDRLCPSCQSLQGKIVGFEEQWATRVGRTLTAVLTPPLHPMCRCAISLVFLD